MDARHTGRVGLGAAVVVVTLALGAGSAGAFPSSQGAITGTGSGVQLQVNTSSDQAALSADAVRVTVDSPDARRVTFLTQAFTGGPLLTTPTPTVLKGGTNHVALPLSGAGRDALAGCGARQLIVTAFDSSGARLARTSASLQRTVPQCTKLAKSSRCETIAVPV